MAKVLIVEDDEVIGRGISGHLANAGFEPLLVARGETGLARLRFERPDVVVLDLMLPGIDGWELIRTARAEGIGTPILVVSARGTEQDRVKTLELGADDYLVKPFSMQELVARVRAAARRGVRAQEETRGDAIELEELLIDPREVQAYVDGVNANLTPTEFRLLYALAQEHGRVVTREELMQRIWGRRQRPRDRTVDVFVRKLRDKIDRQAPHHVFLHTTARGRLQAAADARSSGPRPIDAGNAVHQPRALLARLQRARARARGRSGGAAARAGQVLRDLLVEPRRVLHGPRRRPRWARQSSGHSRALARRADAAAGARRDPRARRRARRAPGAALGARAPAGARRARASSSAASRTAPTKELDGARPRGSSGRSIPILTPLARRPGPAVPVHLGALAQRSASSCATRTPARSASPA